MFNTQKELLKRVENLEAAAVKQQEAINLLIVANNLLVKNVSKLVNALVSGGILTYTENSAPVEYVH